MKRRILLGMALCALPLAAALYDDFRSPPDATRPWCYWYWVNGNVDRETVTETLVMRPDSTGTLRVVARDVVRTTDRSTARATDTVVSSVTASSERRQASEDVSTVEPARVRVPWVWVALPWALLSGLVTLLALYLARKGKTWTSRH